MRLAARILGAGDEAMHACGSPTRRRGSPTGSAGLHAQHSIAAVTARRDALIADERYSRGSVRRCKAALTDRLRREH